MRGGLMAALVAAVTLACAGHVSAATFVLTWSGTIASGTDPGGLFGIAGADLTGQSFTASMTFDPALGFPNPYGSPDTYQLLAGPDNYGGTPAPATFSVGGISTPVGGRDSGFGEGLWTSISGFQGQGIWTSVISPAGDVLSLEALGMPYPTVPALVGGAYDGNPCAVALVCIGQFQTSGGPYVALTINHLTISSSADMPPIWAPIPEPAAWATMVLGLFGLGAALRQCRQLNENFQNRNFAIFGRGGVG